MKIKTIIGFTFMVIGIFWGLLNKLLCSRLCETCSFQQVSPCYFLFLFVGVIFVVDGLSLIIPQKQKKLKKI